MLFSEVYMNNYVLSCCSTADLTKEHFQKRNLSYICFHYELDGKHYYDDLGESMPFDQFYQAMVDGADTKTSQVNVEEFMNYFEPFLKEGKDILYVHFSSKLSGTFNNLRLAIEELKEKYPERRIVCFDSLRSNYSQGMMALDAAKMALDGKELDEAVGYLEENKLTDSYYDFLASEARQASLVAIAKKDVPSKHWNHLSRTLTILGKYKGLISWSGTAFEYFEQHQARCRLRKRRKPHRGRNHHRLLRRDLIYFGSFRL